MDNLNARLPVFVYGTLMPGEQNYAIFLDGRTVSELAASTGGELWLDTEEDFPYLCLGVGTVHGWLVTIATEKYDEVIRAIDRLEDFNPDQPEHSLYLRKKINVIAEQKLRPAWCYIWNLPSRPGCRLTSGHFSARRQKSE